jgi:hypothetical protein
MTVVILILGFLAGFAGAFVGGLVVGKRLNAAGNRSIDSEVRKLLNSVEERIGEFARVANATCLMTSPTEQLKVILGRWHQYNVTRKSNSYTWIHAEYEIEATPAGALQFSVEYNDNQGGTAEYVYEGVMRDDRLVLIGRPAAGEQPCFIEIWPHLGNRSLKYHFGICLNQSWDQQETVIPCILTRTAIDPFDDARLDQLWIAHLESPVGLDVFPRLRSRLEVDDGREK